MRKRVLAFSLGFVAIGLLLALYLFLFFTIFLGPMMDGKNPSLTGFLSVTTILILIPVLIIGGLLVAGWKAPRTAGTLEIGLTCLAFLLGWWLLSTELSLGWDNFWNSSYGLLKPGIILIVLVLSGLLLSGGILFRSSAHHKNY